jgi:hypothetical protein
MSGQGCRDYPNGWARESLETTESPAPRAQAAYRLRASSQPGSEPAGRSGGPM